MDRNTNYYGCHSLGGSYYVRDTESQPLGNLKIFISLKLLCFNLIVCMGVYMYVCGLYMSVHMCMERS